MDAVTQYGFVKIHNQCQLVTRRGKISFALRFMFRQDSFHGFHFHDQTFIYP